MRYINLLLTLTLTVGHGQINFAIHSYHIPRKLQIIGPVILYFNFIYFVFEAYVLFRLISLNCVFGPTFMNDRIVTCCMLHN